MKPPDVSSAWRMGTIETYSPVFEGWIRWPEHVTIRPDTSIQALCCSLANDRGIPPKHVRLSVFDR